MTINNLNDCIFNDPWLYGEWKKSKLPLEMFIKIYRKEINLHVKQLTRIERKKKLLALKSYIINKLFKNK